jgi:hypothetical protein
VCNLLDGRAARAAYFGPLLVANGQIKQLRGPRGIAFIYFLPLPNGQLKASEEWMSIIGGFTVIESFHLTHRDQRVYKKFDIGEMTQFIIYKSINAECNLP